MIKRHLYIHVPFCRNKCNYCDFHSKVPDSKDLALFLEGIRKEIVIKDVKGPFESIYIGGGTPSLLGTDGFSRLMEAVSIGQQAYSEFTLEVNPESVTEKLIKTAVNLGVNRISMGVQSSCDKTLEAAGRIHDLKDIYKGIDAIHQAGVENLSIDIIAGLPLCGIAWKDYAAQQIEIMEKAGIKHFSLYYLELSEDSKMNNMVEKGLLNLPTEEETVKIASYIRNHFYQSGFERYEISNYSLPGYRCRHNMNTWKMGSYIGLGPSACSYIDGNRIRNCDFSLWLERVNDDVNPAIEIENSINMEKASEAAILALRTSDGINVEEFERIYGPEFLKYKDSEIRCLINKGYLNKTCIQNDKAERLLIPEEYMDFANDVFISMLPG